MMYATLGEVVSVATCNRLVGGVEAHVKALKSAAIEVPPSVVMVDGMWVKIAYPTGEQRQDAQGRLQALKRKEKRVVLSALGLWDDSHWEIVRGYSDKKAEHLPYQAEGLDVAFPIVSDGTGER